MNLVRDGDDDATVLSENSFTGCSSDFYANLHPFAGLFPVWLQRSERLLPVFYAARRALARSEIHTSVWPELSDKTLLERFLILALLNVTFNKMMVRTDYAAQQLPLRSDVVAFIGHVESVCQQLPEYVLDKCNAIDHNYQGSTKSRRKTRKSTNYFVKQLNCRKIYGRLYPILSHVKFLLTNAWKSHVSELLGSHCSQLQQKYY